MLRIALLVVGCALALSGCAKKALDPCTGKKVPLEGASGISEMLSQSRARQFALTGKHPTCPTAEQEAAFRRVEERMSPLERTNPLDERATKALGRHYDSASAARMATEVRRFCERHGGEDCR